MAVRFAIQSNSDILLSNSNHGSSRNSAAMDGNFDIYFAGLARNCEESLSANLDSILDICCRFSESDSCQIWVAENDSDDGTRELLKSYNDDYDEINLVLLDDVHECFPERVSRLAYLRETLFTRVKEAAADPGNRSTTQLYIPIDLDSNIAESIDPEQFMSECRRIAKGRANAIFPISNPYYYDTFALRADGWVENDPFAEIDKKRNVYGTLLSKIIFIYSKQKSAEQLKSEGRIPVRSAFGGVGIYDFAEIVENSYTVEDEGGFPSGTCEHVSFNESIDQLEISPEFEVEAPREHISYNVSWSGKAKIFALSMAADIKRIAPI